MIKTYLADRPCKACGYWPNLRRAKFEGAARVTFDTDNPGFITTECLMCGNVSYLGKSPAEPRGIVLAEEEREAQPDSSAASAVSPPSSDAPERRARP